jgi:uncharacterized membrane protein
VVRDPVEPKRIPRARYEWLAGESTLWRDAGLIDEQLRARVLGNYEPQAPYARGMTAIVVLAALMVGIGVLLLIGYNWARLGPLTKVGMTMSGVAAFFAASASAFSRRHDLAGHTLALIGTFAFSSSIWLIAQVLHIQGHFPDGFMWSAVGALAAAVVIGSGWIGIAAAIFAVMWVLAAGIAPPHTPPLAFLAFAPPAFALAYRLASPNILRILAAASALWVVVLDPVRLFDQVEVVFFSAIPLTGCAFYAIGGWHRRDVAMRRAWQTSGLLVLLVSFLVLLIADFHRATVAGEWRTSATVVAAVGGAITATLLRRRLRDAAALTIGLVAGVLVVWTLLLVSGIAQPRHVWVTLFSVLSLFLSVSLIRTALRTDDAPALAFGTLFGLEFLIVRWTSVIENMLWSGLMLLVAGGGLLFIARLWRFRDRDLAPAGRLS